MIQIKYLFDKKKSKASSFLSKISENTLLESGEMLLKPAVVPHEFKVNRVP
jgi:hypothetical protein